jgi:hypothetical protein
MTRPQTTRLVALLWLLLIVVGSLQPARPGPVVAMHRGIHFLAFGSAALLLLLLSRTRYREIRAVAALCLLGLSLEFVQHLVYLKPMEWRDVRDDTLAALAAFLLYRLIPARPVSTLR